MGAMGSMPPSRPPIVVLMDDDPAKIAKAIWISRKCLRIVYENIVFAIASSWRVWCLWPWGSPICGWPSSPIGVMIWQCNAIRALFVKSCERGSAPSKAARACPGVRRQSPEQRQPRVKREGPNPHKTRRRNSPAPGSICTDQVKCKE